MRVGLIPGMSMGSSTSAAVFGSFPGAGQLELVLPISDFGIFAGEVFGGGNGSRCRGRRLPAGQARMLRFLELETTVELALSIEVTRVVRCIITLRI